jgi:hypothetical protein
MNTKKLTKIWKESGSHPWTDKEIVKLGDIMFGMLVGLIVLILLIAFFIFKYV